MEVGRYDPGYAIGRAAAMQTPTKPNESGVLGPIRMIIGSVVPEYPVIRVVFGLQYVHGWGNPVFYTGFYRTLFTHVVFDFHFSPKIYI